MTISPRNGKASAGARSAEKRSMHSFRSGFIAALGLLVLCSSATAGDVYRWRDAGGTVHYGEHPPQDAKATRLSTSTGKRARPVLDQGPEANSETTSAADEENKEEEQQQDKPAAVATTPAKPKKNKGVCERARYNLKTLSERARIRQKNADGEESYLTEEQKDEQKKAAKDAIRTYC